MNNTDHINPELLEKARSAGVRVRPGDTNEVVEQLLKESHNPMDTVQGWDGHSSNQKSSFGR